MYVFNQQYIYIYIHIIYIYIYIYNRRGRARPAPRGRRGGARRRRGPRRGARDICYYIICMYTPGFHINILFFLS